VEEVGDSAVMMRVQETFLEKTAERGRILVIKTYDEKLAREAFEDLDEYAVAQVAAALHLDEQFEAQDIPSPASADFHGLVWEALADEAREEGQIKSFFVVYRELEGSPSKSLYVSPDWPSAEAFTQRL
jgi:hypothetical protein